MVSEGRVFLIIFSLILTYLKGPSSESRSHFQIVKFSEQQQTPYT